MGVPFWGNDFGGAISVAPGFALLAWLLLGRELRWKTVWILVGVLVASGVVVGLVDLLRPAEQRTHVGKFFEKAGTDFGSATLVLRRKASENLSVLGHSLLHRVPHRGRAAGGLPLARAAEVARSAARTNHDRAGHRARRWRSWPCSGSR